MVRREPETTLMKQGAEQASMFDALPGMAWVRRTFGNLWPVGWLVLSLMAEAFAAMTIDRPIAMIRPDRKHCWRDAVEIITTCGESGWWITGGALIGLTSLVMVKRGVVFWQGLDLRAVCAGATLLWFSVAVAGIVAQGGKQLFGRTRPSAWLLEGEAYGLHPFSFDWSFESYPSGHSTTMGAVAVSLCFAWRGTSWSRPASVIAVLCTLGVASTRVLNNAHFVSDVIAGYSLGGLLAWSIARYRVISRWRYVHLQGQGDVAGAASCGANKSTSTVVDSA